MTKVIDKKFNFKSRKITDNEGKEVGKTKKQPALTISIPVPTVDELVAVLQTPVDVDAEGKELPTPANKKRDLVLDAVYEVIFGQTKGQLDDAIDAFGDDNEKTITVDAIDFDKLSLDYIANLPPSQRGARGISEEEFEAFFKDYVAVMVAATGKEEVRVLKHVELFRKPMKVKQNKEALNVLVENLDIYLSTAANLEDTGDVASRIRSKFDKWATEDSKLDLSAL